jgi:uncharacterized phage-associated protein
MTINDIADYIIYKSAENNEPLNLLKLQKLAYYAQAWHLALYDKPLAPGARFQAWYTGLRAGRCTTAFIATCCVTR